LDTRVNPSNFDERKIHAYLSLTYPARAVLVEIAFAELQERGFIDCMTKGAFSRKAMHASEWRLTWWGCDVTGELPSKKFMNWGQENQNTVSKYPVAVPNQSHRAA
jgi:hypothetical protein